MTEERSAGVQLFDDLERISRINQAIQHAQDIQAQGAAALLDQRRRQWEQELKKTLPPYFHQFNADELRPGSNTVTIYTHKDNTVYIEFWTDKITGEIRYQSTPRDFTVRVPGDSFHYFTTKSAALAAWIANQQEEPTKKRIDEIEAILTAPTK